MNKIYFLLFSILFSSDQIPASEQSHPILLRNGIRFVNTSLTTLGDGKQVTIIVDFKDSSFRVVHH